MKNSAQQLSTAGLGICAALLLLDRFVVSVPDWLAILCIAAAIVLLGMSFYQSFKKR